MGKKLVINCADCDTRKMTEQSLANYDSVTINAALILTNARSRQILAQHNVTMNCASVLDIEEDVKMKVVNGKGKISSGDAILDGRYFLLINGSLEIGPGTQSIVEQYVGILINGSVTYPQSLSGALGMMTVNGSSNCYPDGAIILKRSAVIDKTFTLRAKKNLYWAARRLIMVDSNLDPAALADKGSTFSSGEAIIAESKVETLVELIDDKTEIIVVPDGTAVIQDDVVLEDMTLGKYGKKLYIIGNLTVNGDSAAALEQLEYLYIRGDAMVTKDLKSLLLEKAVEITGNVNKTAGRVISDAPSVKITKWLLEQENDGICVTDCVTVKIDVDVPKELILEQLIITDCVQVVCEKEQIDAVTAICKDVAGISCDEAIENVCDGEEPASDTDMVNCASYVI